MMPFYGDPELFRLAVESVLAQTDPDWRLVVVDDVYPDRAPGQWVQSLPDERVSYHRNEVNLGVAGSFAACLDRVEAAHFVMMGCDDLLEPHYVATMRRAIRDNPGAAYFQPGVRVVDSDGHETMPLSDRVKRLARPRTRGAARLSGEPLATSLLRGNWTYFPSICWRTEDVRRFGFSAQYEIVLDLALQLDIIAAGGVLAIVPEPIFRYRRHSKSVSSWSAADGSRFTEERAYFVKEQREVTAAGWRRAARAARLHLSSRLNAATKLPSALLRRDGAGSRVLLRHVFGA